jgi:hypothetical protein
MTAQLHSLIHNNQGHVATVVLLLILKKFYFKIIITAGYFPNY